MKINKTLTFLYTFTLLLLNTFTHNLLAGEISKNQKKQPVTRVSAKEKNENDLALIKRRGALRVCIVPETTDFVPFIMNKNGEPYGLDIDIAKQLAKSLGINVKFTRAKSFTNVIEEVGKGTCDVGLSGLSMTLNRAQLARYTLSYVRNRQTLILNRLKIQQKFGGTHISIADIARAKNKNMKIGVIAGSSYEEYAMEIFPSAVLVPFKDWIKDGIPQLLQGKFDILWADEFFATTAFQAKPSIAFHVLAVTLTDTFDNLYGVVGYEKQRLHAYINAFLETRFPPQSVSELMNHPKYIEQIQDAYKATNTIWSQDLAMQNYFKTSQ